METLDAIMDTAPDIVMTDIRMPGLDGLDLIEKLQSLDSHIQFIILTGYPEFDYARRAIKYGVREYLLKPISEEAIIDAVNHVKKSLPVYSNPGIADLVSRLLICRQEGNTEQARLLLDHFFTHFSVPCLHLNDLCHKNNHRTGSLLLTGCQYGMIREQMKTIKRST